MDSVGFSLNSNILIQVIILFLENMIQYLLLPYIFNWLIIGEQKEGGTKTAKQISKNHVYGLIFKQDISEFDLIQFENLSSF